MICEDLALVHKAKQSKHTINIVLYAYILTKSQAIFPPREKREQLKITTTMTFSNIYQFPSLTTFYIEGVMLPGNKRSYTKVVSVFPI